MKALLTIIIITVGLNFGYSQKYDLIVNTKGDSIACQIDSISNSQVYLKMKINKKWTQTYISKEKVIEIKYDIIDRNSYTYKPGTSYILSEIEPFTSVRDLRKIAIYSGYYLKAIPVILEVAIPIGKKSGMLAGCGILETLGSSSGTNPVIKIGMMHGKNNHFIEAGSYVDLVRENEDISRLIPYLGYRYQSPKGYLFRADVGLLLVGVSIGFSF